MAKKKDTGYSISDLIDYYETCNKTEGKSQRTSDWYTANLRQFLGYLKSRHLSSTIETVDILLLRQYVSHLMKKKRYEGHPGIPTQNDPISLSTVHSHVRTLRAFFSWLTREGLVEINIAKDLKPPKLPRKVVSPLTDEEINAIIKSFQTKSLCDIRNQVIFMLLVDSGLRIGEVVSLRMDDSHIKERYLKVLGKGNKERIVPIGTNVQRVLLKYVFRYRPEPVSTDTDNLFLSTEGKPLSVNSMKLMFKRLACSSGVDRLHAHLCRHTFATRFLINGGDLFSLQQILGHSTLEMVRHYVNIASSQILQKHHKFSPLDHLSLRKT